MHTPTQLLKIIEDAIPQISYPKYPADLYAPIRYIMSLGGKRIRPVMVLMSTELFTDQINKSLEVALAIETFHNFTLVHDDIMDNAPLRRGKATVHEKWGTNNAILSGDVMMVESNKHLSKVDISVLKPVLDTFNATAQGVCEGQQLDMEFEMRNDVSIEEYIDMIRLKTAVLLGGAMKLGAIVGGASEKDANLLYNFGENLGIAFQLQDDILDVFGNPEKFGKQVGGDIIANKKTYLNLKAHELAKGDQLDILNEWTKNQDFDNDEKVNSVKEIYNELNIREISKETMNTYLQKAIDLLEQVNVDRSKKENILDLTHQLMVREF